MAVIIEPFKVKVVEPIAMPTREERERHLASADYNLFRLPAEHVTFDLLTDSGTAAMSAAQWGAMMVADESYAGSRSYYRFEKVVKDLTGYSHIIPTHQGRAAERIFFGITVKPGMIVPSNSHFDTTRANIEHDGGEALDLVIEEASNTASMLPFKGNIDLARLEDLCRRERARIPLGMLTITNNTGGGQPVSLENLRGVRKLCDKYKKPFFLDACRFAENSYFIKIREAGQGERTPKAIAQEMFSLADGCVMSAKKDGLVNIGGFLALRDNELSDACTNLLIITEGFTTYGGLAGRDMEAMAVGLEEVFDRDYLRYRIRSTEYLGEKIQEYGIPIMLPVGGHAVYVDAKGLYGHIPVDQYPGQTLVCALYLTGGIRCVEIGSVMFGKYTEKGKLIPAPMELVRLAIPRRVYTQSHVDYVVEVFQEIAAHARETKGMRITHEPKFLRHFTAHFEPVA